MKNTDKLTRQQVLSIPQLLKENSIGQVAIQYNVSWQAIWYWIGVLRSKGVKIVTRRKGKKSLLFCSLSTCNEHDSMRCEECRLQLPSDNP